MGRASGVGGRENPGPAHFDSRTLRSSCSCCDGGARKLKGALPGLGCPLGTLWAAAGTTQLVSHTTPFQPSQPVRYRNQAPVQQPREDKIRLTCTCTCGLQLSYLTRENLTQMRPVTIMPGSQVAGSVSVRVRSLHPCMTESTRNSAVRYKALLYHHSTISCTP